jgi:hypothetical protein
MPETILLREAATYLQDFALFLTAIKPALLTIGEFVVFLVGLITVVWLAVRAH